MARYIDNMDEYIKREDAIKAVTVATVDMGLSDPTDPVSLASLVARRNIKHIPAAEVVPRSEVERLEKEVDRLSQVVLYHDAFKADEIREIFEEIETLFGAATEVTIIAQVIEMSEYKALKKKYLPETKVSSGDICVVCGESVPEGRQVCGMCETGQEFLKKRKE